MKQNNEAAFDCIIPFFIQPTFPVHPAVKHKYGICKAIAMFVFQGNVCCSVHIIYVTGLLQYKMLMKYVFIK